MHTQNIKGAAHESKETGGKTPPLGLSSVTHYSADALSYTQNLVKAVADHPYLNTLLDELAAQTDFSWNGQTGGRFHPENAHAMSVGISPVGDCGQGMESFTFEEGIRDPDCIDAYAVYARSDDGDSLLHDAYSLAEGEFMALLAVRCINRLTTVKRG